MWNIPTDTDVTLDINRTFQTCRSISNSAT